MSEASEQTYAAVITINLPGMAGQATTTLTLTPPETIASGTHVKRLRDCTLADLGAFTEQMEAEVWEAYRAIKLMELAQVEEAEVKVTVLDAAGQPLLPLQNWPRQAVLLAPDTAVTGSVTPDDTSTAALVTSPVIRTDKGDDEAKLSAPAEDAAAGWAVIVADSEPVHEEREARQETEAAAAATPGIIPSQARVRVAGQRLPAGHPTWAAVDILIDEPALRAAQAHALSSLDREVAGILVGPPPEKQPDGRYVVHVIDTIVARHTVMHGASVTYTPESWRYVNDRLAERYPDETAVMVGWYHTHPGFGIFLSGMDQFIHQNFFTQVWHTALVLDPLARKCGFFCWNRDKTRVRPCEFAWPNWAADAW